MSHVFSLCLSRSLAFCFFCLSFMALCAEAKESAETDALAQPLSSAEERPQELPPGTLAARTEKDQATNNNNLSVEKIEPVNPTHQQKQEEAQAMAQISGSTLPGIIDHLLIRPLPEQKMASHPHMSIAICYPSIGRSDVDSDIRQWAADIADAFERNFDYEILSAEMGRDVDAALNKDIELAADYSVSRPSSKALSITFHLWNHVGGPHANLDVVTLNYSLINGQRLHFVDLFKKPDEALRLMSEWSRAFLVQRYGTGRTQMLLRGTEPEVENFSSLTLTPSGISIHFQPYQVATWEMGVQTVEMPLEALASARPLTVFWER